MKSKRLVGVWIGLWLLALTPQIAPAQNGSIGLFADPDATRSQESFTIGVPRTLYIVARLAGQTAGGMTGAEFRIDGLPAGWATLVTPNPGAALTLGDPFRPTGSFWRANIVFPACEQSGSGLVLLYTVMIVPTSAVENHVLTVEAGQPPTSPLLDAPLMTLCDPPTFTQVPVAGDSFVIQNVNTPQILDFSQQPGFEGADGVHPNLGAPGQVFEFRVVYSDVDDDPPAPGQPLLHLDANGDGDTGDPGEGDFVMLPLDLDSTYVDGKEFFHTIALGVPVMDSYGYRFSAVDTTGVAATTAWMESLSVRQDLPDLAVHSRDILFSNPDPAPGDSLTVTVRFTNASSAAAENFTVGVYDAGGELMHSEVVPHVGGWTTGEVVFAWSFPVYGMYAVVVHVDEGDSTPEWNEANNSASRSVVVRHPSVTAQIDVQELPGVVTVAPLTRVTLSGRAVYLGALVLPPPAVQGATATLTPSWDVDLRTRTGAAGGFSQSFYAPALEGDFQVTIGVSDSTLTGATSVDVRVVVEPGTEPPHGPDLAISLTALPSEPCEGDPVTLQWSVTNQGDQGAAATVATLSANGGPALAVQSIGPLSAGQTVVLSQVTTDPLTPGTHWFTARVDAQDGVWEFREDNNTVISSLVVGPSCYELDPDYVRPGATTPCVGRPTVFWFRVHNTGCPQSPPTRVAFLVDGQEVQSAALGAVSGRGGYEEIFFTYMFPSARCYEFSFVVDPDDAAPNECNETNNTLSVTVCAEICPGPPPEEGVDYSVSGCDVGVSDDRPVAGQDILFQATVRNVGVVDGMDPVFVRFMLDGLPVGPDVPAGPLPAGDSVLVASALAWSTDFAPHLLSVMVDPDTLQLETSRANNAASCPLPYELHPEIIPACPPGTPSMFSSCSPCLEDTLSLHGVAVNTGAFSVDSVRVEFRDHLGGTVSLGTVQVHDLRHHGACAPRSTAAATIRHAFDVLGDHPVEFVVDSDGSWPEYDEGNNGVQRTLRVACVSGPDLTVGSGDIVPSDSNPDPGGTIDSVMVTVHNVGVLDASNVRVRLTIDGGPLCADLEFGSIPAGGSRTVTCDSAWVAPAGSTTAHVFEACADPDDLIPEIREDNNCATRSIVAGAVPDLFVLDEDIEFSDPWPDVGDAIAIAVPVKNGGGVEATGVVVFEFEFPGVYRLPIAMEAVVVPSADGVPGVQWVQVGWLVQDLPGYIHVTVIDVSPPDADPTNNHAVRAIPEDGIPVPVALMDFEARSEETGVRLRWKALPGFAGFGVERRRAARTTWERANSIPSRDEPGYSDYAYLDESVVPGVEYEYRILGHGPGSDEQVLGVLSVRFSPPVPTALALYPNAPNPFNPVTRIRVAVPERQRVAVRIFDASGRFVAVLWNGPMEAGRHTLTWDGRDSQGRAATSGIYFCRMTAEDFQQTRKLVLLQ
ncbi:MAG: CARDB domain-containing protein [Candidatus Krumholzibacteriia bacterium]